MSESGCTCGHTEEQHHQTHGYTLACAEACYCLQYRPRALAARLDRATKENDRGD